MPITAILGLASRPIPGGIQIKKELERSLTRAGKKIRAAEAADKRAAATERMVKEAEAKYLVIGKQREKFVNFSKRPSN